MGNASGGGDAIYGFVVFSVLLVIGLSMVNSLIPADSVNESATNQSGMAFALTSVVDGVKGGYSLALVGIGILAAVAILRSLDYL